jgi:hypothetical protein
MNPDREHVSTSLYDFRGSVNRPGWPVPPPRSHLTIRTRGSW